VSIANALVLTGLVAVFVAAILAIDVRKGAGLTFALGMALCVAAIWTEALT
jgi:hypothetical protein